MFTGLITRVFEILRQFWCGLHGHDSLLHFETGRLSMRCTSCGYESPGWDLKTAPGRPIASSKPRVVRMPLVREHRAA
jgi:hypothetical protein